MKLPTLEGIRALVRRLRPFRFRLSTALCLVVVAALIMAYWAHERQRSVPWHKNGGMIGWTQASMVARLGEPAQSFEDDLADPNGHEIRRSPPTGPFRTLVFRTFDGTFVAWFAAAEGKYTCFRSTWVEKGNYY